MMTDVVVVPSLEGLLAGCMLLLTGPVPFVVVIPTVCEGEGIPTVWRGQVVTTVRGEQVIPTTWGGQVVPTVRRSEDTLTVWKGLGIDAVGQKHTT